MSFPSDLYTAKQQQLLQAGVPNPSESTVRKAVSREEAARHCHRRTRDVAVIEEMLENLLLSFSSTTDTLGVPVLKDEMTTIWEHHIKCLQDPPGVSLYTVTGELKKRGCDLADTSLCKSVYLPFTRFIPGTEHCHAAAVLNLFYYTHSRILEQCLQLSSVLA